MIKSHLRQIAYLSGTRADFGLMASSLRLIDEDPRLSLGLIVTGMHLSDRFGMTVREIEDEGFSITSRVSVDVDTSSGAEAPSKSTWRFSIFSLLGLTMNYRHM